MAHPGSHHHPSMQFNVAPGQQGSSWPRFTPSSGRSFPDHSSAPQVTPSVGSHFPIDDRHLYQPDYHHGSDTLPHLIPSSINSVSPASNSSHMARPASKLFNSMESAANTIESLSHGVEKESRGKAEANGPSGRPLFVFSSKTDSTPRSLLISSTRRSGERAPSPAPTTSTIGSAEGSRASPLPPPVHSLSSTSSPAAYRSPSSTPRLTAISDLRPSDIMMTSSEMPPKSPPGREPASVTHPSRHTISSQDSHSRHPRSSAPSSDSSSTRSGGTSTLIPVNLFPSLYHDLLTHLDEIAPDDYNQTALQTLVLESAMIEGDQDLEGDDQTRQALLLQNCIATVLSDTRNTYKMGPRRDESDVDLEKLQEDMKVVERYNSLMNGLQYRIQRLYRNSEAADRYIWTREDFRKIKEAFRRFGYAPSADHLVAEYVGKGMQISHIQYFKRALKQRLGGEHVREIVESEDYEALIAGAPQDDGRGLADLLPEEEVHGEVHAHGSKTMFDVISGTSQPSSEVSEIIEVVATPTSTHGSSPSSTTAPAPATNSKRRGRPPKPRQTSTPTVEPSSDAHTPTTVPNTISGTSGGGTGTDSSSLTSGPNSSGTTTFAAAAASNLSIGSLPPSKTFLTEMAAHGLTEEDFRIDTSPSPSGALSSVDTPSNSSSYTQVRDGASDSTADGESPSKKRLLFAEPFGLAHSTVHTYQPRAQHAPPKSDFRRNAAEKPQQGTPQPQEMEWTPTPSTQSSNSPTVSTNAPSNAATIFQNLGMPPQLEANLGRGEDATSKALAWLMQRTSEITSAIQAIASQQKPAVTSGSSSTWGSPSAEREPPSSSSSAPGDANPSKAAQLDRPGYSSYPNYPKYPAHGGSTPSTAYENRPHQHASPANEPPTRSTSPSVSLANRGLQSQSLQQAHQPQRDTVNSMSNLNWLPESYNHQSSSPRMPNQPNVAAGVPPFASHMSSTNRWPPATTAAPHIPAHLMAPSLPQNSAPRSLLSQQPRASQGSSSASTNNVPAHLQHSPLPLHVLSSQSAPPNAAQIPSMAHLAQYPYHNPQHTGLFGMPSLASESRSQPSQQHGAPLQYPIASILDSSLVSNPYNRDQAPPR